LRYNIASMLPARAFFMTTAKEQLKFIETRKQEEIERFKVYVKFARDLFSLTPPNLDWRGNFNPYIDSAISADLTSIKGQIEIAINNFEYAFGPSLARGYVERTEHYDIPFSALPPAIEKRIPKQYTDGQVAYLKLTTRIAKGLSSEEMNKDISRYDWQYSEHARWQIPANKKYPLFMWLPGLGSTAMEYEVSAAVTKRADGSITRIEWNVPDCDTFTTREAEGERRHIIHESGNLAIDSRTHGRSTLADCCIRIQDIFGKDALENTFKLSKQILCTMCADIPRANPFLAGTETGRIASF